MIPGLGGFIQFGSFIQATGGTVTTVGNFRYHTFTSSGTFTVLSVPPGATIDYVVIAGGGGGGNDLGGGASGGGGAGGVVDIYDAAVTVQSYPIVVGAGGAAGVNGANSTAFGQTAIGGGFGGRIYIAAGNGGSGGGGGAGPSPSTPGGVPTPYQGNFGGPGLLQAFVIADGGGGGGRGSGATDKNGGPAYNIFGTDYAGGGGGGSYFSTGGTGGGAGAGNGGSGPNGDGQAAAANTGSGGGGGSNSGDGGAGGSGVVVIRYRCQ